MGQADRKDRREINIRNAGIEKRGKVQGARGRGWKQEEDVRNARMLG